jgi:hypothetical protein
MPSIHDIPGMLVVPFLQTHKITNSHSLFVTHTHTNTHTPSHPCCCCVSRDGMRLLSVVGTFLLTVSGFVPVRALLPLIKRSCGPRVLPVTRFHDKPPDGRDHRVHYNTSNSHHSCRTSPHHSHLYHSNTDTNRTDVAPTRRMKSLAPRPRSVVYMAVAMALHFGGYEFLRNSCLALFTSSHVGFQNPAAFPLANALVSPFAVLLLLAYSRQLARYGPRIALCRSTAASVLWIATAATALRITPLLGTIGKPIGQALILLTFLFQSSYQYLLYTQHWSFVGSVLTPDEASRWFPVLAGASSIVCTLTGSAIPYLVPRIGLLGLMAATAFTLTIALFSGDRAYHLAQRYGFDPSPPIQASTAPAPNARQSPNDTEPTSLATHGRLQQAIDLFRRVPTLRALFLEVLSFQSLNTILQIALVRTLKTEIPDDVARSAYTGRLYAVVNACSALFQFGVFPFVLRRLEPRWIWRALPWGSWILSLRLVGRATSLTGVATAVVVAKVTDYAVRSVVYPMAYQPLDYHSRYVGKEVIGVFGSRTGKSGVSLLLSSLTMLGCTGLPQLNQLALVAASLWMASTVWLSRLIPTQADAQARVEQRQQTQKAQQGGQPTTAGRIKLE